MSRKPLSGVAATYCCNRPPFSAQLSEKGEDRKSTVSYWPEVNVEGDTKAGEEQLMTITKYVIGSLAFVKAALMQDYTEWKNPCVSP